MTTSNAAHDDDKSRRPAGPGQDDTSREPDVTNDPASEPDNVSLQDWVDAENSRPTLPEETADGLDEMDEEVRRQAEDLPADTAGRL